MKRHQAQVCQIRQLCCLAHARVSGLPEVLIKISHRFVTASGILQFNSMSVWSWVHLHQASLSWRINNSSLPGEGALRSQPSPEITKARDCIRILNN